MPGLSWSLLLIGAKIAVQVSTVGEVPAESLPILFDELEAALTRPERVVLRAPASDCDAPARCAEVARRQTGAEDVVLIELFGGPLGLRCVVSRVVGAAAPAPVLELDVPAAPTWPRVVAAAIQRQLDPAPPPPIAATPFKVGEPGVGTAWVPWAVAGASVVVVGAGVTLGILGESTQARARDELLPPEEQRSLHQQASTEALAANVLLAVGVSGLLALGIGLALMD